jgi:hypothetical protein
MAKDFKIVQEKVTSKTIGNDGNLCNNSDNCKCFLKNQNNKIISHQYECMLNLGDDHFAVCEVVNHVNYFNDGYSAHDRYYGIAVEDYEVNSKLKWGIIKVTRDEKGTIKPFAEILIVPFLYDRIDGNNEKTATVYNNGFLTYLDIDEDSENYGKQLVPCVLEHAVPFSTEYEGFAECSIDETTGYLPRNCKIRNDILGWNLLTPSQTEAISEYFDSGAKSDLDFYTYDTYFRLTGIRLGEEKQKVRKLTRKDNNKK